MSKGCTTRVAARPAVKPAAVSIMDGESGDEDLPVAGGGEGGIVGTFWCLLHDIGCINMLQDQI